MKTNNILKQTATQDLNEAGLTLGSGREQVDSIYCFGSISVPKFSEAFRTNQERSLDEQASSSLMGGLEAARNCSVNSHLQLRCRLLKAEGGMTPPHPTTLIATIREVLEAGLSRIQARA